MKQEDQVPLDHSPELCLAILFLILNSDQPFREKIFKVP